MLQLKIEDLKNLEFRSPEGEFDKWGHYLNDEQLDDTKTYDVINSNFYLSYLMGYGWSLIEKDDKQQRVYMRLKEYQNPEAFAKEKADEKLRKETVEELKNMTDIERLKVVGLYDKILQYLNKKIEVEDLEGVYNYKGVDVIKIRKNLLEEWKIQIDNFIHGCFSVEYDFDRENLPLTLKRIGVISKERYYEITEKKPDPNEDKEGYFQCWECGCWEPINKRQEDGTCGC